MIPQPPEQGHGRDTIVDWIVEQISHVEALTPMVTAFGNRAFREVIKVEWGHEGGAPIR